MRRREFLADNVLFLVRFLDPGQRSFAAFAKRGSLLAGPLAQETMSEQIRKQTKPAGRAGEIVLRCNFARGPKTRLTCAQIKAGRKMPWKGSHAVTR
jgi:hypothetical protein